MDATANAIFEKLVDYLKEKGLSWENCKSVTTDGAAAMTGSINGVVKKIKERSPKCVSIHCILHREALVAKKMKRGDHGESDTTFAKVLQEVVGIVNLVRSHSKKCRIFAKLCEEMDASFTKLLLHAEVRWLSRGKVLSRIFLLKNEMGAFLTEQHDHRASKFYDNYWLAKVAYMASIFEHLNKLNLNLQSRKTDIFESMSKVNAVKKKLPLWQKRVASNNFSDFPLLHDFMKEHGSTFQQQLIPLIDEHLNLLQENFDKYFNSEQNTTLDANSWILQPFIYDTAENEDLIDLQSDFGMKALFQEKSYSDFWVHLLDVPEYRSIAENAICILIQMPTTDLCKSGFSCLCEIKSRKRNSITHIDPLMRGAIEQEINPRFEQLVENMQEQKSH